MSSVRAIRHGVLAALLALLAGCATAPVTPAMRGDAERPAQASGWMRSELYFAVGNEDGNGTIDDARWRDFLDREVTPRFPDGLTVLDGYGQWRFREQGRLVRQRCKVLVLLHEDTAQRRTDIDAIRQAWKRETAHESVLWARQTVEVSF
ncbi:DUF3574 domain-containing protein [Lysobacter niastensis]|uniref:DUF3574 domain-containing protein n=1 Tax=Lysobacter niastensis TaxID=380629 RepID=A0ABS0BBL3_9GAMM|nr:DUF3574 domain-containing protein [Lysobacter niastensis]MBF6025698.1 DUF3574 domain-containing protein [Lysobacter niastensis]